jgi:hypothetical protein
MEFFTSLDIVDAVMKQCGPEVPYLNDFLGGGHTQEVTTTSTTMTIVQDFFGFVNSKTYPKYGVESTAIESIFDEEKSMGLIVNASTIISREMRPKILCP